MSRRQVLNLVGVVVTIAVNGLANALPLGGRNTGAISDSFRVLWVPAGYVFAIWGLIYLGFLAFAIYGALPRQRRSARLDAISPWFVASCACNALWIFFWHFGLFPLTLIAMLGVLACLIVIYLKLDPGRPAATLAEKLCVEALFSIYLGWISVATIANVEDVLWLYGYRGAPLGELNWAVALSILAAALGIYMALARRDALYAFVVVWALAGVMVRQVGVPPVATSAQACASAVAAATLAGLAYRLYMAHARRAPGDDSTVAR